MQHSLFDDGPYGGVPASGTVKPVSKTAPASVPADPVPAKLVRDGYEEYLVLKGLARSSRWGFMQTEHLKKQPACLVCGSREGLNVHHKFPFHYVVQLGRADLELDERNLFTLCVPNQCHVLIGHLGSYESYNPKLEYFIALARGLTSAQIRAMPEWGGAVSKRPAQYEIMTEADRSLLLAELNWYLPMGV